MQHFVLYCQCYGSVYHRFSAYWALRLAQFTVDFVHNLYFQVRLVKYERHAVAHHTLYIQASGTNDTKSQSLQQPIFTKYSFSKPEPRPAIDGIQDLDCYTFGRST